MASFRATFLVALLFLVVLNVSVAMKPTNPKKLKPTNPKKPVKAPKGGKKMKKLVVPPAVMIPKAKRDELRRKLKAVGGCNANVCFAIDGSDNMPKGQFQKEKDFVQDLVSIIAVDEPVEVCAVQYADFRHVITPLTVDTAKFNLRIDGAKQRGGLSFTRGGIEFCAQQLSQRKGEANKMVLLTDGITSTGRNAVRRANRFRRRDGDLSVVAAGERDRVGLMALAGWDRKKIFDVGNFFDVLQLEEVITGLVAEICDVGGKSVFPPRPKSMSLGRRWNMEARKKRWNQLCSTHQCTWKDSF